MVPAFLKISKISPLTHVAFKKCQQQNVKKCILLVYYDGVQIITSTILDWKKGGVRGTVFKMHCITMASQ